MANSTAIMRHTFLELEACNCHQVEFLRRPRAETDTVVDYHSADAVAEKSCSDDLSARGTTVGEPSLADSDSTSCRSSRWEDESDDASVSFDAQNASAVGEDWSLEEAPALAGPPGCHRTLAGPPGCHQALAGPPGCLSRPMIFTPPTTTISFREKRAAQKKEVTKTTTLVVKHLPDGCTSKELQALLHERGLAGKYDFLYVPLSVRTWKAVGYGLVNFCTLADAKAAVETLHGTVVEGTELEAEFSKSHGGLKSLVDRYRHSPVVNDSDVPQVHKPLVFSKGKAVCFPWHRV